jgi:uncharacterized OsmC-like protein
MTIAAYILAPQRGIDLKGFSVDIEGDLDPDGFLGINEEVRKGFSGIRIKMNLETDATLEDARAFARFIESRCPVGDTLTGVVPVICDSVTVS